MNQKHQIAVLGTVCCLILFAGCALEAETPITDEGHSVELVTSLSPSEADELDEIGPLSCYEVSADFEESCKNELRNAAADEGADIVVIESEFVADDGSLQINARAYRHRDE